MELSSIKANIGGWCALRWALEVGFRNGWERLTLEDLLGCREDRILDGPMPEA